MFKFNFWKWDKWIEVVVDDRLPFFEHYPIFSRNINQNHYWLPLLEKVRFYLFPLPFSFLPIPLILILLSPPFTFLPIPLPLIPIILSPPFLLSVPSSPSHSYLLHFIPCPSSPSSLSYLLPFILFLLIPILLSPFSPLSSPLHFSILLPYHL